MFSRAREIPPGARDAVTALLWSRAVVWAAGLIALGAFGRKPGWERFDPAGLTTPFGPVGDALIAPAARWDAVWFLAVAGSGYDGARPAFFPLYPALVWAGGLVTGSRPIAALLVSGVAAVAALAVIHRLAALELGERYARPAVLVTAFFPTSLFLTAMYSEAIFLALSAGAFLAARREAWWLAGGLGALAAATRSVGIALVLPLAILAYETRPGGLRPLAVGLVPLGLLGYCGYLAAAGEDPLAPFAAQEVWMRSFAGPFVGAWDGTVAAFEGARQLLHGAREPVYFEAAGGDPFEVARRNLADFAFLVFAAVATAGALRRLPLAYGAWALVAVALPLSYPVEPQPLMSLGRFVLVLFPLHLWLAAALVDRGATERWLAVSGGLLAVLSAQFAAWEFVG